MNPWEEFHLQRELVKVKRVANTKGEIFKFYSKKKNITPFKNNY